MITQSYLRTILVIVSLLSTFCIINAQKNQCDYPVASAKEYLERCLEGEIQSDNSLKKKEEVTTTAAIAPANCATSGNVSQPGDGLGQGTAVGTFTDFPTFSSEIADDFIVPGTTACNNSFLTSINVVFTDFNGTWLSCNGGNPVPLTLTIYEDMGGNPGATPAVVWTETFDINNANGDAGFIDGVYVPTACPVLCPTSTYWLSVESLASFADCGQEFIVITNPVSGSLPQWQNPADGFGTGCTTWGDFSTCTGIPPGDLQMDLAFCSVETDLTALDDNLTAPLCGSVTPTYTSTVAPWTADEQAIYDVVFLADGVIVQQGDMLTYTGDMITAESCDTENLPVITVEIRCTGCPDELTYDNTYVDNTVLGPVYPDASTWTVIETPGECFMAGMVQILAEDGASVCFSMAGDVPPIGTCPDSPGEVSFDYAYDPGYPAGCNMIFSGTVDAMCLPKCIENCVDAGNITQPADGLFGIMQTGLFTDFPTFEMDVADDFVVPGTTACSNTYLTSINVVLTDFGGTWLTCNGGSPVPLTLTIYEDMGGNPGSVPVTVWTETFPINNANASPGQLDGVYIPTACPALCPTSTYWLSVIPTTIFLDCGQEFLVGTNTISGSISQWQNPLDGFGTGCTTWTEYGSCFGEPVLDFQMDLAFCSVETDLTALDDDLTAPLCGSVTPTYTATVTPWNAEEQDIYDVVFLDGGVIVQQGDMLTYAGTEITAETCDTEDLPDITVEIRCTGCPDELAYDNTYTDNTDPGPVYPDASTWTVIESPGGCGIAAMVQILAEDGVSECFSMAGDIPPAGTCPDTPGDSSIDYAYDPGFPTECNNISFSGNVAALCLPIDCIDCPAIAPAITPQDVCSGSDPDFTTIETEVNATGNNIGAFAYYLDMAYTIPYVSPANLTCAPYDVTIYGQLICSDAAAVGTGDEFDDFSFVLTVYPDVSNWVVTPTDGDCSSVASVEIFAEDGSLCFTESGTAIPQFVCPDTAGSEPLNYSFDPGFPESCNMILLGTIDAICNDNCCADNGTLTIKKRE